MVPGSAILDGDRDWNVLIWFMEIVTWAVDITAGQEAGIEMFDLVMVINITCFTKMHPCSQINDWWRTEINK